MLPIDMPGSVRRIIVGLLAFPYSGGMSRLILIVPVKLYKTKKRTAFAILFRGSDQIRRSHIIN